MSCNLSYAAECGLSELKRSFVPSRMRDANSMAGTFVVMASQRRKNGGIVEVRCKVLGV